MKTKIVATLIVAFFISKSIMAYYPQNKIRFMPSDTTGLAQKNEDKPISPFSFDFSYTGDIGNNFSGGIKQTAFYLGMANVALSFSTEDAKLWKGGELFIHGANTHGATPSENFIGDFQVVSNLEAGDLTYFHELWFNQAIGDLSFRFGLQDLNAEFLVSENAGLFLNSSFGVHSTISDNVPVPIFPLTALGAMLQYDFSKKFSFKVSVFDGMPDDFENNPYNIKWNLKQDDGLLSFGEMAIKDIFKSEGTYKIGGYYHNHIPSVSENLNTLEITDNYGVYFVTDQSIYKNDIGKELSLFAQASISPNQKNENCYYLGAGINYKGIFLKRTNDVFGIALAHAGFKNNNKNETTIEMTYQIQINDNISIQPNLQYIINPSGTDTKLDNSLVGLIRLGLTF